MINLKLQKALITFTLGIFACLISRPSNAMIQGKYSLTRSISFLKKTKAMAPSKKVPTIIQNTNIKNLIKLQNKPCWQINTENSHQEHKKLISAIKAVEMVKDYKKNVYQKDAVKLVLICSIGLAVQPYIANALPVSAIVGLALTTQSLLYAKFKKDVFETPLCKAIREDDLIMVQALIVAGMDVNKKTFFKKETPLMIAAQYGNIKIINELIRAGADINAYDYDKKTALDHAQKMGLVVASEHIKRALEEMNSNKE